MKYPILAYPHALTPESVGDLLAWHRTVFGDTHMEDDGDDAGDSDDNDDDSGDESDAADKSGDADNVDWKSKFEAQQKVNKSLEAKLKKSAQGDGFARAKELEAELAKLQGREAEYQAAQEAQKLKDEALSAANVRILKAEIRAAAAGKLADPQDALRLLDLSEFEVGSEGDVDGEAVAAAIDDLIKKKPYLSAQGGKRFGGDSDGGRKGDRKKSQLTREDLKGMSPEAILTAQKEGRLADLIKG